MQDIARPREAGLLDQPEVVNAAQPPGLHDSRLTSVRPSCFQSVGPRFESCPGHSSCASARKGPTGPSRLGRDSNLPTATRYTTRRYQPRLAMAATARHTVPAATADPFLPELAERLSRLTCSADGRVVTIRGRDHTGARRRVARQGINLALASPGG